MRARWLIAIVLLVHEPVIAGGPEFVAGASYFDPTVKGLPLTWPQGVISYFTDQGGLSPILLAPNADSFVATAFGMWNSVPTSAILLTQAGHLAEDVTGATFTVVNGMIAGPPDITPSATGTAIGIVYDEDGSSRTRCWEPVQAIPPIVPRIPPWAAWITSMSTPKFGMR